MNYGCVFKKSFNDHVIIFLNLVSHLVGAFNQFLDNFHIIFVCLERKLAPYCVLVVLQRALAPRESHPTGAHQCTVRAVNTGSSARHRGYAGDVFVT